MSAPYSVSFSLTDDTTFGWEAALGVKGEDPFPWEGARAEYSIRDDCGRRVLDMTSDQDGLWADAETSRVVCSLPSLRLRPGTYQHGLRLTYPETGVAFQVFDGSVTITEGNI